MQEFIVMNGDKIDGILTTTTAITPTEIKATWKKYKKWRANMLDCASPDVLHTRDKQALAVNLCMGFEQFLRMEYLNISCGSVITQIVLK